MDKSAAILYASVFLLVSKEMSGDMALREAKVGSGSTLQVPSSTDDDKTS
jgi:hypothetical protein